MTQTFISVEQFGHDPRDCASMDHRRTLGNEGIAALGEFIAETFPGKRPEELTTEHSYLINALAQA